MILDNTDTIIDHYSLDKEVIGGFVVANEFYYNMTSLSQLNTLEKNNWKRLLSNSTDLANKLWNLWNMNKIPISYTCIQGKEGLDEWDGWG